MPVDAISTEFTFEYSHTIGFMANQGRGFNNPIDLAIAPSGELYVLNRAGPEVGIRLPYKRVTICTAAEEYLGEFSTGGTADGQLWWPSSLAFDSQGLLYVADEALNHVSVFNAEGAFRHKWGVAGDQNGQLNRPSYLVFDGNDDLYITDSPEPPRPKVHQGREVPGGVGQSWQRSGPVQYALGTGIGPGGQRVRGGLAQRPGAEV